MKKTINTMIIMILVLFTSVTTYAQVPGVPNTSTTQTLTQELGIGKITLTYSRPNVKGREIFGALVPYGEVWRTGANTSTQITFTENVLLEGHAIPAGSYSLFTIPNKDSWTIILSKKVGDWGSYSYKQENDFLRFNVKAAAAKQKQETLTFGFENATTENTVLNLSWDKISVDIHMQSNDEEKILANIDRLMAEKEVSNLVYFTSIQYYYLHNKDTDKALGWIARAKKDFPKRGSYRVYESRMLLRKGDKAGAIKAAEEGIRISTESNDSEYLRLNQEALAIAKKK
ncbi:DUF2911 domain-containing protein [Chitinophaga sp. S165]|uniref:DUF2911 domain-containing protein n=1 Tax=Chitinophaga sp. S165 TaxID=2135462 RepID=UPI000D70BA04|nr:DUF2911 domain-containing protein [Chitinophaga sp. S165]PWV48318.1 hypothetical protein C7475_107226 [Chitinophaga sp. S165]